MTVYDDLKLVANADRKMQEIDLNLPLAQTLITDLVAHDLLTQVQADALIALGNTAVPWWQANGYSSPIGTGDMEAAGLN